MALVILRNAVANAAAVGFQFLFAGAARADAAGLPGKFFGASGEPRQHVIELGEFDLQLPFPAARVPRKNIEDQLRAVDHAAFGAGFQVAQLRRRKIPVENDQRRFVKLRLDLHFLDFAAPDHGGGIDLVAHLKNASGHLRARAARQFREFLERSALRFSRVNARHMRRPASGPRPPGTRARDFLSDVLFSFGGNDGKKLQAGSMRRLAQFHNVIIHLRGCLVTAIRGSQIYLHCFCRSGFTQ